MVFPYMDHDLCGLLANSDFKLTNSIAKLLMKQILQGMDYIHAVCPPSCHSACFLFASDCSELMTEQLHSSRYQDSQHPCGSSRGD